MVFSFILFLDTVWQIACLRQLMIKFWNNASVFHSSIRWLTTTIPEFAQALNYCVWTGFYATLEVTHMSEQWTIKETWYGNHVSFHASKLLTTLTNRQDYWLSASITETKRLPLLSPHLRFPTCTLFSAARNSVSWFASFSHLAEQTKTWLWKNSIQACAFTYRYFHNCVNYLGNMLLLHSTNPLLWLKSIWWILQMKAKQTYYRCFCQRPTKLSDQRDSSKKGFLQPCFLILIFWIQLFFNAMVFWFFKEKTRLR